MMHTIDSGISHEKPSQNSASTYECYVPVRLTRQQNDFLVSHFDSKSAGIRALIDAEIVREQGHGHE